MKKSIVVSVICLFALQSFSQTCPQFGAYQGIATGTDTYVVSIPAVTCIALKDAPVIYVKNANSNTTASTLKVNAFTALPITINNSALVSGQFSAGVYFGFKYDLSTNSWQMQTAGGALSLAVIGSSPNANGATLSGSTFNLQPASATFGGVLTSGTQAIAGPKSFTSDAFINTVRVGIGIGLVSPSYNTVVGYQTAFSNSTGNYNTTLGYQTLYTNSAGEYNTAIGYHGLYTNTGSRNSAFGAEALFANIGGGYNTGLGSLALSGNTSGGDNTGVGALSLLTNTIGTQNTGVGTQALFSNLSGIHNTGLGVNAGYTNSTGSDNVFIGYQAGYSETGSNKLYISNSNTATPLIGGDFSTNNLTINGSSNITTSLTTPLLIGGTTTTSPLTYKTTTGVGTTGADHIFQVGNNGDTVAMRITNGGMVGIGITPANKCDVYNTTGTINNFRALGAVSSSTNGITNLLSDFSLTPTADISNGKSANFILRIAGSQNVTSSTIGLSAAHVSNFNSNTGTITRTQGLHIDLRNLSTGTITTAYGCSVIPVINSGGGIIDNFSGFNVGAQTVGSTLCTAFSSSIAAAPNRYGCHMSGTAQNYFAGYIGQNVTVPLSNLHVVQSAVATGVIKGLIYTGAVNTNQTLSTEIPSITFTTAGRQWATGAITTQREILISAPTYSFVGASTISDGATLAITAAPIAGTNATITRPMALWVQAGQARFDGQILAGSGVSPNGGGIKHKRITTGSVSAGSTALVTITWDTAFADDNYTISASVLEATASSLSMSVVHIESQTASAVTVRVLNNAVGSLTGTVHIIAIHD